jgi:hypothetical protein
MIFRLRQIEVTAAGREIVRDRDLAQALLNIGRAAGNDIHLPDLAIEPRHATIAALDDGRIAVKAAGTLGFGLDGAAATEATIDPRGGAELRFGSYRITVSREEDGAVLLLIRMVEDQDRAGASDGRSGFSLAGVLPGKRPMAWIALALILVLFLALPIGSYLTRDAKGTVIGDASWSAGKLSLAHHALEDRCEACHVRAFESVRDATCISCHQTVHDHADKARLMAARSGQPLGTKFLWSVARAFGREGPGSCADCHVEHQGETRMQPPAQKFCADCHASLKDNLADTALGDASDFGTQHPQFTPAVVTDPFARKRTPVSLDAGPRENSGLTFPHKLHLDRLGGVARMAASFRGEHGYGGNGLECKDCHRPSEDGIRFKPIAMERDCEGCHSLAYDKVGTIFRRLRHGDVEQMIADLSVAGPDRPIVTGRSRPGDYAEGRPYHFDFSPRAYNASLIRSALSRDGICGECHTPTFENGLPGVVPVTLVSRYMPGGDFDHKAHSQEKCTSCHLAEKSSSSADVLLPGIKTCRTCHLGEAAAKADVPSSCAMCHSYHPPSFTPPADPDRLARR